MQNCSDILFFAAGKISRKNGIYFTPSHHATLRNIAFVAFSIYLYINVRLHNIRLTASGFYSRGLLLWGYSPQSSGRGPQGSGRGPQGSGRGPQSSGRGPQSSGRGPQGSGRGPQSSGHGPQSSGRGPQGSGHSPQSGDCISLKYLKPNMNNLMLNLNLYSYE
jgi:hypothetical protein